MARRAVVVKRWQYSERLARLSARLLTRGCNTRKNAERTSIQCTVASFPYKNANECRSQSKQTLESRRDALVLLRYLSHVGECPRVSVTMNCRPMKPLKAFEFVSVQYGTVATLRVYGQSATNAVIRLNHLNRLTTLRGTIFIFYRTLQDQVHVKDTKEGCPCPISQRIQFLYIGRADKQYTAKNIKESSAEHHRNCNSISTKGHKYARMMPTKYIRKQSERTRGIDVRASALLAAQERRRRVPA